MNGGDETAVKQILLAIENGALPPDETQRRLMELIQKEATRIDGPANEELISACMDLMERLQGRESVEDGARIAALNQRIADAIQKKKRNQERLRTTFRTVGAIAAMLVLLVGIGIPLRWTWFESWSTPDEQQHVIMGHEITVDMVASAIAEKVETDSNTISITDVAQIDDILGLELNIPSILANDWIARDGYINYSPGYIKISLVYANEQDDNRKLTCIVNLYTDVEYAYFSFEQSREGDHVSINGIDLYVSDNVERSSVCWYNNAMYMRAVGQADKNEITEIVLSLIGGEHE